MNYNVIIASMDPEVREIVHNEHASYTAVEFLTRYLEIADEDLIIG
jgi:hypothetical protein